jgi:hypothetical protein
MMVARRTPEGRRTQTPREETAKGVERSRVIRYGDFVAGSLSPRSVEGLCRKRSWIWRRRLAGCDWQNRRRQREIERHEDYRGRCEVESDYCRSRGGEAEMKRKTLVLGAPNSLQPARDSNCRWMKIRWQVSRLQFLRLLRERSAGAERSLKTGPVMSTLIFPNDPKAISVESDIMIVFEPRR